MKKLKIVFILMGLMLSILLITHKTGMGGSSLRLTGVAKQQIRFPQRASRAQIGWIFDKKYDPYGEEKRVVCYNDPRNTNDHIRKLSFDH